MAELPEPLHSQMQEYFASADQYMIALAIAPLVGFLAWRFVRFRLVAKAKAYAVIRRRAKVDQQLGGGHPPSWNKSATRQREFFACVARLAARKGVPSPYANTVLGKETNVRRLTWYIGALEAQGASWLEQQMAVADQIAEWWAAEERALKIMID